MNLATVVIVGRPNVGKSSLFNRVLGRRAAVVANREGVTRDRHYQMAEWSGIYFQLVDTGGFIPKEQEAIDGLVRKQIEVAVADADLVVFLVDGRVGITEMDQAFARLIQRSERPVMLAVNKAESKTVSDEASQYWALGLGEPLPISALHGSGVYDLLDALVARLPAKPRFIPREDRIKVAILGRPNAGKSTLVNSLVGEERVITSEVAGTTRDAIDTEFEYGGRKFLLTDTAGLRRKARVKDEVEYFSNMRALEAIRRSDLCLLLVDASRGMEIQDFRICTLIQETGKGLIICLNKWDAMEAESKTFDHMVKDITGPQPGSRGLPLPGHQRPHGQAPHPGAGRDRQGEGEPGQGARPRERDPFLRGDRGQASPSHHDHGAGEPGTLLPGDGQSAGPGLRGEPSRAGAGKLYPLPAPADL